MRKSSRGNPWHDEKGRFCSGPKGKSKYTVSEKTPEEYEKRTKRRTEKYIESQLGMNPREGKLDGNVFKTRDIYGKTGEVYVDDSGYHMKRISPEGEQQLDLHFSSKTKPEDFGRCCTWLMFHCSASEFKGKKLSNLQLETEEDTYSLTVFRITSPELEADDTEYRLKSRMCDYVNGGSYRSVTLWECSVSERLAREKFDREIGSKYKVVDENKGFHFPNAHSSLEKAKKLKRKGYKFFLDGKEADIEALAEEHEWTQVGRGGLTPSARFFSYVKEYQDDKNKVFYVELGARQNKSLM